MEGLGAKCCSVRRVSANTERSRFLRRHSSISSRSLSLPPVLPIAAPSLLSHRVPNFYHAPPYFLSRLQLSYHASNIPRARVQLSYCQHPYSLCLSIANILVSNILLWPRIYSTATHPRPACTFLLPALDPPYSPYHCHPYPTYLFRHQPFSIVRISVVCISVARIHIACIPIVCIPIACIPIDCSLLPVSLLPVSPPTLPHDRLLTKPARPRRRLRLLVEVASDPPLPICGNGQIYISILSTFCRDEKRELNNLFSSGFHLRFSDQCVHK